MKTPSHDAPQETPKDAKDATPSLGDLALDLLSKDETAPEKPAQTTAPAAPKVVQTALKTAPDAPTLENAPPFVAKLEAATKGLLMPSETDAPFRTVYWPLEKAELSTSEIALYAAEKAEAKVVIESVEQFFEKVSTIEDWMNDDEKAKAERFGNLVKVLEAELENPHVYLIGERERTVAVIGKVKGGFGGVITLVVET